tara:strand:+ start:146 stop:262 length:117 start_codon:yes stop_codon:yes gene_type:complete
MMSMREKKFYARMYAESDLMYADDVSLSELWQSNSWVV